MLRDMAPDARERLTAALGRALASQPCVRVGFLFGSFARGEPFRDIDVGIFLVEPFGVRDLGCIAYELSRAAGNPPFDIDLVPLNDAPPPFRLEVARRGVLLAEGYAGAARDFEMEAQARSSDLHDASQTAEGAEG